MTACHNHISTKLIKNQVRYLESRLTNIANIGYECYRIIPKVIRGGNTDLLHRNLKGSLSSLLKQRHFLDSKITRIKNTKNGS